MRRAQIIGTGLIGGSVGLALKAKGWYVTGDDRNPAAAREALARQVIDSIGIDETAEICFLAMPVSGITVAGLDLLDRADWVVTDVGSVKAPVVRALDRPRFVGGHPQRRPARTRPSGARPRSGVGRGPGPRAPSRCRRR